MRIAIVGAGALGLYYGALLQRSGEDLHFLLRRDYQAITRGGLRVESVDGDFHLPQVAGYRDSNDIGVVDLVLIGLKAFANERMNALVRPLVGPQTVILTLQNGLGNEDCLAEAFPSDQIMGGVAFLCANRGEPGTVRHLGLGSLQVGAFAGLPRQRCEAVAEVLQQAGIACTLVDDLMRARWEKLVWNIPFNGLSALTGADVTALLARTPTRTLAVDIMREVIVAANSQPLREPLPSARLIERMVRATEGMDHYRPSMQIDRQEGRPLELEAIYAEPLRRAAESGVDMPCTRMLHRLLAFGEPWTGS